VEVDAIRINEIEFDVANLKRIVASHETLHQKTDERFIVHEMLHQKTDERMLAVDKRVDVLTENTLAVVHLTTTINALIEALAFARKMANVVLALVAAGAALWAAVKYAWNHL
jgi:hypothetical protein